MMLVAIVVRPNPIFTEVKIFAFLSVEFELKTPYIVCTEPKRIPNTALDLCLSGFTILITLKVVKVTLIAEKTIVEELYPSELLSPSSYVKLLPCCPLQFSVTIRKIKIYNCFVFISIVNID